MTDVKTTRDLSTMPEGMKLTCADGCHVATLTETVRHGQLIDPAHFEWVGENLWDRSRCPNCNTDLIAGFGVYYYVD